MATATATRKYPVPAIAARAKYEEVSKTAAMSAERSLQITQDGQTSNDQLHPHIGTHH
ncbi:MAG TPA: hypothetical protein VIW47_11635 [Nitrospiraceae bacterium]